MAIPFLSDIRLPSSGKVYLWTGHNSNFLQYNLWHASASGGMFIKNISSSGDIYFQTNSSTALTIDSNQNVIANAFTGRLQGAVSGAPDKTIWCVSGQYTNWGIFYNEGTPDKIEFKAGGTVTSTIALDNGDITTSGNLDINGTGNSTFAGNAILQGNAGNAQKYLAIYNEGTATHDDALITFKTHGSRQYSFGIDRSTTNLAITTGYASMSAGDVLLEMDSSGNSTFAGTVAAEDNIHLTDAGTVRAKLLLNASDRDNVELRAESLGSTMKFFTVGTEALGLDASQNATFKGKINAKGGSSITGFTAATINAYTATVSSNLYSALRIVDNTAASTYWDIGAVGGASPDLKFFVNASTSPKFTLSTAGNATFAGTITTGNDLTIGGTGGIFIPEYIYHVGDTNTYMGFETSDTWRVVVGGAEALNINTSRIRTNKHIEPSADSTYNIGTNSVRFSNIYADTLHGTVALATQANNLQSFDDRDIAPEDLSFSDDLKLFFAEKTGIEGGTVGSDWQDLLILSSYVDSSGGKLNALALDKSTHRILHYNASHNATNWGTAKELAYTSDFVKRTGGTSSSMTGDLHIIAGAPKIYLQDNTDDDDQQIVFRNNGGSDEYKIATQDFTSAGTGDGLFIGSETTDPVKLVTNDTIALAIDSSQHVSLPGAYLTLKDLNSHAQILASSSSLMIAATNIQTQGNLIPDGTGNRNLGASNRYWAETYTNGVTSGGNIVINSNTPILTLGVINSSTGNSKIQFYSKNSGAANGYAVQYNKDTGIDRLEFIDGSGTANIKFINGGAAEFAGSVTASQINTGQGATEVHLMNQNLRTTDDVTFDDLTVTGNLTITGDINSYNVTDLDITDKTITLGKGQDEGHSGGSGLVVDGSGASILWDETNETWDFNKGVHISGQLITQALDASASIVQHLRCSDGSNAATFRTTTTGRIFEIRSQNSGSLKFDSTSSTFTGHVNASTGFRMASGQAIDFISTNIGYNSIERNTTVGGLQINTGDTNSMNILDNGRVGISTSAPESKLHVIDSSSSVQLRLNQSGDNDAVLGSGTNFFQIKTGDGGNSTALAILHSNQYVGIGTTSPTHKLHVAGTTSHTSAKVSTTTANANYVVKTNNSEFALIGQGSSNRFDIWDSNAGATRLSVNSAGGVGIGDTAPTSISANTFSLSVNSSRSDLTGALINKANGTVKHQQYWDSSGYGFILTASSGDFKWNFGSSEKMRLTETGNVGIGTASPGHKLNVAGANNSTAVGIDIGSNAKFDFAANSTSAYATTFNMDDTGLDIGHDSTSRALNLKTGGADRLTILGGGNVGIGDAAPVAKLHITASAITGAAPTTYGHVMIEDTDAQIDLVSSQSGTWGSAVNFKEHNTSDASIDVWSIARKTTAGAGDSSLNFNFGTGNLHSNTTRVSFSSTGKITTAGGVNYTGGTIATATTVLHTNDIVYNIGGNNGIILSNYDYSERYYITNADHRWEVGSADAMRLTSTGLGIGTTSPTYKLSVAGGIEAGGKITYSKSYGSLNATGNAVAGLTTGFNGASAGFEFKCYGGTGKYQRIVYSCYNGSGTWYAKKVIDEGTNDLDVSASADGATITFTYKATSTSQSYSPRILIEATGHSINSTYA